MTQKVSNYYPKRQLPREHSGSAGKGWGSCKGRGFRIGTHVPHGGSMSLYGKPLQY